MSLVRRLLFAAAAALTIAWLVFALLPVTAKAHPPLKCRGHFTTMMGSRADDVMVGTPNRDIIWARRGDDSVFGLSGNDLICGGKGDDEIFGGDGTDHVRGGHGDDECSDEEHRKGCER